MTYSFPGHPAGAAGAALLLLRIAAAVTIAGIYYAFFQSSLNRLFVIALGLAVFLLLLGLGTRIVALVCAVIVIAVGLTASDWQSVLVAVEGLNLISIGLLGAGAYSVDAHLLGRRVIRLDS